MVWFPLFVFQQYVVFIFYSTQDVVFMPLFYVQIYFLTSLVFF